jgi:hypothetical protein
VLEEGFDGVVGEQECLGADVAAGGGVDEPVTAGWVSHAGAGVSPYLEVIAAVEVDESVVGTGRVFGEVDVVLEDQPRALFALFEISVLDVVEEVPVAVVDGDATFRVVGRGAPWLPECDLVGCGGGPPVRVQSVVFDKVLAAGAPPLLFGVEVDDKSG